MSRPPLLYVTGASKEPERVRRAMRAVEALGCQLTLDWLTVIESTGGVANEGLDDEDRAKFAGEDLRAIRAADLVWVLAPENASTGAWVELGYAIAVPRSVIVSGPARQRSIFCALAEEYDTDAEALAAIRRRFGARRSA